ncbi:MAG: tetratricopeptide repeat protein, partial [Planctomycetes bacterium]|nr:tetratricopeptide repeat protein [Planctomycetota bacterium]
MRTLLTLAVLAGIAAVVAGPAPQRASAQEEKPPAEAPKSSPEALRLYADAANFQNNGAFELAAEEWEKFLQRFPQDPLAGKAQYYAGVCRLQLKEHQKAIAHFEAAVANYPQLELAEDARFNLAAAQYTLAGLETTTPETRDELYGKSAAAYGALLEQYPEGKYAGRALFWRGEALYRLGKKAEALQAYAKFVEEHPESNLRADGLYVLGVTHEELGQFAEAGKVYGMFLAEFPEHELVPEVRMRKAETLLQAGQLAEAEKVFNEVAALEGFAQADHAAFRQALAVAKQNRFVDAANLYATIPNNWPQSVYVEDARMEAARAYYRGDKFDTAAPWLQKVIETSPKYAPEAAHWLARIHLHQGDPQKAAELAAQTIPKAQDSPYLAALKMDQAEGLLEAGDGNEEALELFVAIAEQHPESEHAPSALYNAAFAAMSLGRHEEALQHAQAYLAKFPEHDLAPDVKYIAAESHLQLRNHDEAAKIFAELAAADIAHPDKSLWRLRWGNALYLQKKYQETIDALSPLVKTFEKPEDAAEAQFLIGASRFYLNQPAEAEAALAASVDAAPQGRRADEALLLLSRAHRAQNKLDEAKAAAGRLIEEFPQSPLLDQAHYRLGEYHYAAGEYAEAAGQYDAVVAKAPQSVYVPYALYGKGWALLQGKEFDKAAEALTTLLTNYDDHPLRDDALFARAMSRRQIGDQQGAMEDADAYLAAGGEQPHRFDALYERGLAETALDKHAEAAKTFETILAENPNYEAADKALYQLAWAHKSAGDTEKAVAHFAKLAQGHRGGGLHLLRG